MATAWKAYPYFKTENLRAYFEIYILIKKKKKIAKAWKNMRNLDEMLRLPNIDYLILTQLQVSGYYNLCHSYLYIETCQKIHPKGRDGWMASLTQ